MTHEVLGETDLLSFKIYISSCINERANSLSLSFYYLGLVLTKLGF